MASNHQGGTIILTGAWQRLSDVREEAVEVTVRAAQDNDGTALLGKAAGAPTGFLLRGEAKTYHNLPAYDVWVAGTAGDVLYWDGTA